MAGNLNSPITQRLLDTYEQIVGSPDDKDLMYLHSVLASVGLPYREPKNTSEYQKQVGYASLVVQAGYLMNPETGEMVKQGIPHGTKPRLLMLHLNSEAVKRQSPRIEIADSMSAFMRDLGLKVSGGKKGTISGFKEQLNRLVASNITLGMYYPHAGATTLPSVSPIKEFSVWFPQDPNQKVLWSSEITLNYDFYQSLINHALPLDMRAIQSLQHNARALDLYMWLAMRLRTVKRPTKITWDGLQSQFGQPDGNQKSFIRAFRTALNQALTVYPKARVEDEPDGIIIHKSPPPVAHKTSVQITKG